MNNCFKFLSARWRALALMLLFVCFGTLTAFEPLLHAHELDPTHAEQDCSACHWSQTSVDSNSTSAEVAVHNSSYVSLSVGEEVSLNSSCPSPTVAPLLFFPDFLFINPRIISARCGSARQGCVVYCHVLPVQVRRSLCSVLLRR